AAALVPMVVGFIWYNPKVFGTAWMKVADMNEEKMQGANMAVIFGVSYLLSVFLAAGISSIVIHQGHIYSVLMNEPGFKDPNSEVGLYISAFMENYGDNFRSFKHGAFHGALGALLFALPVLGINALFERKSFKYIALNTGYWIVTFALMGGIICQFA
ncbi:MAG: DUF1761 domain-containing protein, partial [Chitinophagales bacterium]